MRDWSQDDNEPSGWVHVEFAFLVLLQVTGVVALIVWLLP